MNVADIMKGAKGAVGRVATRLESGVLDMVMGGEKIAAQSGEMLDNLNEIRPRTSYKALGPKPAMTSVRGDIMTPKAPEAEKMGWGGLFDHVSKTGGFGYNMARGGMLLGGAAALGSGIYGAASIAMPANAEANNPFKNTLKGVGYGVAAGALYAATKGLGAEGLRGMVNPEISSKLANVQRGAKMVSGAFDNKLVSGAIGAAVIAGSGDLTLTKPVNPVY